MKIRFHEEQLQLFAAASLDFNPLHLSREYARTTAFGERVVFGMLGFAACLGHLAPPPGKIISSMRVDLESPLFLGVDYSLVVRRQTANEISASLMDGSASAIVMRLRFRDGTVDLTELGEAGTAPRESSRPLRVEEFQPGLSFAGHYAPPRQAYLDLLTSLGVDRHAWGDTPLLIALCSSYLTGMELPGENAIFTAVTAELAARPELPADFEITLDSYDERFQLLESHFELAGSSGTFARGQLSAVARSPRERNSLAPRKDGSGRFAGKTALVIGASRGLGAALALELVAEGCTVIGSYARSHEDIQDLQVASRDLPGRFISEQGDASDLNWCVALRERIREQFGGLDILVCSAAPAPRPLRIEEAYYERMQAFLQQGFALVGAPLSSFLQLVAASQGKVLLISSAYVEDPPKIWPHYVTLKAAAEALVRSAAVAHPKVTFWIARPGKLRTDMSNTPSGWFEAEEAAVAARRIIEQLGTEVPAGEIHFCR
ncbi:MAG: SDR family NAD(P)-dependent oxidoreductase [Candidatus Korobacteraceae bacterium]